ncbi:MAG: DNA primase [Deltaproteobacteria bacterium]|nr:DNA primase [Deltaproteobacteria bacterium]MBW2497256.1 DNA primase [Deltaproteobacteria bacterium]
MSRIPEATIQEIRHRADIVALVSRYVELKQAGRNWKGLCPFHEEKTPSFNVNSDRDIFHCFGCQAGGDVIGFLMKHDGLSFPEAARMLAGELGIEIPEERDSGQPGLASRIFQANEVAQELYRESIRAAEAKSARAYLVARGFDGEAAAEFGIGYAPARWDAVAQRLRGARIPAEIGREAGLLAERKSSDGHYDRLRGRITFPIQDVRGRVIGFGGRAVEADQEPKYLNTPESPVFHKRQAFYGYPDALEAIRRAGRVILCEGYFDRIAFARAGLREALATCGTALSSEHGAQLRRRTREVVLVFDGDAAGQQATEKALGILLPHGLRVRAALIPGGGDPDDYLNKEGAEALCKLVDDAPDALELTLRNAVRQGASTPDQKADVVARVAPLVARVADAVSRDEYTRRLALAVDASVPAVASVVRDSARGSEQTPSVDAGSLGLARTRRDGPEDRQLRALARLCLRRPELVSDETALCLQEILPEGSWKSIILQIIEAAADGSLRTAGGGEVDPMVVEARLDEDAQHRLREIAIDDTPVDSERTADQVLEDLIGWFEARRLAARERELKQRLRDPSQDHEALLAERDALLLERRARMRAESGVGSGTGRKGASP